MSKQDIKIPDPVDIDAKTATGEDYLDFIIRYSRGIAKNAHDWYALEKKRKQWMAKFFRALVIISTAVAGILPILSQIFVRNGVSVIPPAWASVAIGFGAMLILFDRFFGFSSGWMRFIGAMTRIRTAINEFDLEYAHLKLSREVDDKEKTEEIVALCKKLIARVNGIVTEETLRWDEEFKTALGKLDEEFQKGEKTIPRPNETVGGINLRVANGEDVEEELWLQIDDGAFQRISGNSVSLTGLAPGVRKLTLSGKKNGKQVTAEKAVMVSPGLVCETEMELK